MAQDQYLFALLFRQNDDHDTGKYADINRKFLKSYIGISNILGIYDRSKFKPILYYLTKKRLKGNIYQKRKIFTEAINYLQNFLL